MLARNGRNSKRKGLKASSDGGLSPRPSHLLVTVPLRRAGVAVGVSALRAGVGVGVATGAPSFGAGVKAGVHSDP